MRNRLPMLSALAAGLAVAATAVTSAAAGPAATTARPGTLAVVARTAARTVVLINGDRIMETGRRSVTVMPADSGLGGSLLTLGVGGVIYEIPAAAMPYLGKGLDLSLFNASDLLKTEHGDRVPVRVAYRGRPRDAARREAHPGWPGGGRRVFDRVVGEGVRRGVATPVRRRSLPGQLWTGWHVRKRGVGQPGRHRPGAW